VTSLSGEFQTDLEQQEAIVACADAVHNLGWRIETVEANRIVSYVNSGADGPPKIEVVLSNYDGGTDVRIMGSDSEVNPLSQDALIAELNRARDAIQASMEQVEKQAPEPEVVEDWTEQEQLSDASNQTDGSTQAPPPGWYENPDGHGSRWWDGSQWTEHRQMQPNQASSISAGRPSVALWVAAACLALMVVGSLGPWAKALFVSKAGTEGDGVLVIIAALIMGALLWRYGRGNKRRPLRIALVLGVLAAAVGIYDAVDISNRSTQFFGRQVDLIQVGWGLWVAIAGSVGFVLAALVMLRRNRADEYAQAA
jgi:hypothetical protein